MPDRWGRPTFSDGLDIARTVQYFKNENERDIDRKTEQDSYKVADAIANKKDISGFSDEARFKGANLHWDTKFNEVRTKTREQLNTNAGKREQLLDLQLKRTSSGERLKVYKAARVSGNDALAKQLAVEINNLDMFNGRYIEGPERRTGETGYKVTNWDGSKQNFDDIPIEQIDQLLGAYFDKTEDEIMNWQLTAVQKRRQKNEEILSQAEPWVNEKTGQVIYKIPSGTWGPDGKPRGSFFVDGPMAQNELSPEQTKGFVKFSVATGKAGLEKTRKDIDRPNIVAPGSVVTQGGKAGLITTGKEGAQFEGIKGGLDTSSLPGKKGAMNASQQYNLSVKRLDTELMPFLDKGQSAIDPETLQITNDGRNALMNALSLAQKYEKAPDSLSSKEQALVNNAIRAMQIYQSLSEGNRQAFNLEKNPAQSMRPENTQLPPGFVMDQ